MPIPELSFDSPLWLYALLALGMLPLVLRFTLADMPRLQMACSLVTRIVIIALVALALARATWQTASDNVAVLLLADASASVPSGAPETIRERAEALREAMAPGSELGLALFAESAQLITPVSNAPEFPETIALPAANEATDFQAALEQVRGMMPGGFVPKVVLLSDGNDTSGGGLAAAGALAGSGIDVYTETYESLEQPEVLLESLEAPSMARRGASFTLTAIAQSSQETTATATLFRNGFKLDENQIALSPGETSIRLEEPAAPDGLVQYEVRLAAAEDFFANNNVAKAAVRVEGEPRVLLLEGDEREARHLTRALAAENIQAEVRGAAGMPANLAELAAYEAIIYSDVPAPEVSAASMQALRTYVEELGGGFIMLGGEESFGLGGYHRTAVEELLPVRMRAERRRDEPSLAMSLVIDKSGSMNGEKIELAKEAAISAVELLGPRDFVGVVVFDGQAAWAVDMQSASNRGGIMQTIASITAGGGTNLYPALDRAYGALASTSAVHKHCIVLTDGQSQPGDFAGIVDRMALEGVTVSGVAVGQGADTSLLQDIARWGNGRYYFTDDPYDIPQIFAKETMQASRSSLIEEPFLPLATRPHEAAQGIEWDAAPFLFGYVATTGKPTAEVVLSTERGDPLLAVWQSGLGRTAAFTSDAKGRWASDWLTWPGYSAFWSQLVRYVMRPPGDETLQPRILRDAAGVRLVADAVDANGNFRNRLAMTAELTRPDGQEESLEVPQVAPGRYEAALPNAQVGTYVCRLKVRAPEDEAGRAADIPLTYAVSYLPEYRNLGVDATFMRELAEAGGGRANPSAASLFTAGEGVTAPRYIALWPWLLGAAVLLLVLDVALRRIDLRSLGLAASAPRYG